MCRYSPSCAPLTVLTKAGCVFLYFRLKINSIGKEQDKYVDFCFNCVWGCGWVGEYQGRFLKQHWQILIWGTFHKCLSCPSDFCASSYSNGCKFIGQIFSNDGQFKSRFGIRGRSPGQLQRPTGVAVHPSGDIIIADYDNKWVSIFSNDGKFKVRVTTIWPLNSRKNKQYDIKLCFSCLNPSHYFLILHRGSSISVLLDKSGCDNFINLLSFSYPTHAHIYTCVSICMHMHTYMYIHIYGTHMHIYAYTYMCILSVIYFIRLICFKNHIYQETILIALIWIKKKHPCKGL